MKKYLSVRDLSLHGKKVLIRVDFNVPMDAKKAISDDTRIQASLPTIEYVLAQGGIPILMSHFGRPKSPSAEYSLAPCAKRLEELLGKKVIMAPDSIGEQVQEICKTLRLGDILLLENVRFHPAEEEPSKDPSFAKALAACGDYYVNDAFGAAHRAHSSTTTITSYFPGKAACGFLMEQELRFLGETISNPIRPFYAIIGGAKISTKLKVLHRLTQKVDLLLLGGGMAYTFLQAKGINVGNSLVEPDMLQQAKELMDSCKHLLLPCDVVAATSFSNDAKWHVFDTTKESGIAAGYEGMDIGPKTTVQWSSLLSQAKTVLWNGPVGVFEFAQFSKGTETIAKTLANLTKCTTIVGGGDSVAAVQKAGVAAKITHLSTGGGASLEFLESGTLPGVEALSCPG